MIKEYENELNELKESELISKEDLHEGDEIIYNGEHYFVTRTDTGTDFVWITDDESERYNRNAQGWTLKADWIDKVIGQPEEDELEESLKESYKKRYKKSPVMEDLDFADEAEIRKQLAKYSGQYLTITFKGSEDWKHISDLLDDSINSDDEEEEELALDKLASTYRREYDLLKSLEVEEISEIADYTSYVIVTIKVEKDNLLHNFSDNYSDLINMPSIDTDTIKILELDKPTIQDTNTSSMTRDEMVDFIADYVWDLSDTEYRKFKDKIALNFGIIWDNLKEDPEEGVYPSFTDNGLRIIIDKIIKAAKLKDESLKEAYQDVDSMSREELMDEIDDIYGWALHFKHTDITSIIEDPEIFNSDNSDSEEGYFKGVPTDKLRGVLKILRKMKDGGSLTTDDKRVFLSRDGFVNESLDFTNAADVKYRLGRYSGQYLTVTFRGSYDWKYISDLLEEYADGDEEEADLALDKLEAIYGSEYKLLKALEVDEISEIAAYISDVLVTIKVDKDDLYHNYADLINNPSIKKDTVKILELELNESLKKRYKKFP
jgi:hypothetical protein